ncbi:hypothetical protein [Baekduia sp.]|uniref:hypothetical protein n=1 Tax=Baekduia sp. TaxID=2600305 RepID=UPI002DF7F359|nr:hypothetical protein [Baekduia sp.]
MQIALVAVVLLAGMWFTVLRPKPAADTAAPTPAAVTPAKSEPVAPGVKGLTSAIDKAKGASATSDATNAKIQQATGGAPTITGTPAAKPAAAAPAAAKPTAAAKPAVAKATPAASKGVKSTTPAKAKTVAAVKTGTKVAAPAAVNAKPAANKAADVDPSDRLLKYLTKGKTLVILFHGAGADDRAARKAVHRAAAADPKHIVSAYIPIGDVGKYEAITTDVQILSAPSILVIGTNGKATLLTGYVDAAVVRQTVGDARRESAADAKSAKTTK